MNNVQTYKKTDDLIEHESVTKDDIVTGIRNTESASDTKVPSEKAIARILSTMVEVSDIVPLFKREPPEGFLRADGSLVQNASILIPNLVYELQQDYNLWKLKTEEEWQSMSSEDPWNGIGGVPHYVLNLVEDTVRLPDVRGMYIESEGFDGLRTGDVHGDMIRNITGTIEHIQSSFTENGVATGVFSKYGVYVSGAMQGPVFEAYKILLDVSTKLPTGNANKPRAFGMMFCIYTG